MGQGSSRKNKKNIHFPPSGRIEKSGMTELVEKLEKVEISTSQVEASKSRNSSPIKFSEEELRLLERITKKGRRRAKAEAGEIMLSKDGNWENFISFPS